MGFEGSLGLGCFKSCRWIWCYLRIQTGFGFNCSQRTDRTNLCFLKRFMQAFISIILPIFQHLLMIELSELCWLVIDDANVHPRKKSRFLQFFQIRFIFEGSILQKLHGEVGKKEEKGAFVHMLLSFLLRRFIIKRWSSEDIPLLPDLPHQSLFFCVLTWP